MSGPASEQNSNWFQFYRKYVSRYTFTNMYTVYTCTYMVHQESVTSRETKLTSHSIKVGEATTARNIASYEENDAKVNYYWPCGRLSPLHRCHIKFPNSQRQSLAHFQKASLPCDTFQILDFERQSKQFHRSRRWKRITRGSAAHRALEGLAWMPRVDGLNFLNLNGTWKLRRTLDSPREFTFYVRVKRRLLCAPEKKLQVAGYSRETRV